MQGRIQGEEHPVRAPPKIGKNMIFWCKVVIFHTKYPKNVHASLRLAQLPDNGLQVMAKLHPDNKTCIRKIAIYLSHKLNKL
jgi:hypothetical protein